jgi:hypothetical protein
VAGAGLLTGAASAPAGERLGFGGGVDTVAFRGGWYGQARPYVRGGYGVAGYYGRYGRPRYYPPTYVSLASYGQPGFDSPPPASYPPPDYFAPLPFYCPIGLTIDAYTLPGGQRVESYSLGGGGASYAVVWPADPRALPMPPARDATYLYDGGPDDPVPLPGPDPDTASAPHFRVGPAARPVSLAARRGAFVYPAYGEAPERLPAPEDRSVLSKDEQARKRSR